MIPTGKIEFIADQPTLFTLMDLAASVAHINDKLFTQAIAESLMKINNPPAFYRIDDADK